MHRFYINSDDIEDDNAVISGQDAKHLSKVLRLNTGDRVELLDGRGKKMLSEILKISSKTIHLKIIHKTISITESPAHITVAQGFLKDKKMDMLVRHLTELGMNSWRPFFSERSVPSPSQDKIQTRLKRWQRISKEAIKQCGRTILPEMYAPVSLSALLQSNSDYDQKIAFWENASCPLDTLRYEENKTGKNMLRVIVLTGPEGGFSDRDVQEMETYGFKSFSLGPRILRAETAAIAACALVQHIFGDLGKNSLTHR